MNRKASQWSFVLGAIGLIIGIGLLYLLFGLTNKPINETTRCATVYCFDSSAGCPQDKDEPYYRAKELKCDERKLICCTPMSDPLSIEARAQEKDSTNTGAPANPTTIPPVNSGRIHLLLNDGLQELPLSSTRNLEIGKSYTFKITADGLNSDNCMIQILDETDSKVPSTTTWITGDALGTASCTSQRSITITPNDWSLNNERYKLEIALINVTTKQTTVRSSTELVFVAPEGANNIVVT